MVGVVSSITRIVNEVFMLKKLFFLQLLFFFGAQSLVLALDSSSGPDWDASAGFNSRVYPLGAQFFGTLGAGKTLWGSSDETWKYGFARLALNGTTSAVVNSIGPEIQFFPISILGLSAGYDIGTRNFVPKWGVNCAIYECNGRLDRRYLKAHLFAGYQRFIFAGMIRYEEIRVYRPGKPLFDMVTLLTGKNTAESILTLNPVLLYKLNSSWSVGGVSLYSRALEDGGYSHLYGLAGAWNNQDRLNIVAGLGLNRSPVVHSGFSGFFLLKWNLRPSLSIADQAQRIRGL